VAPLFRLCVRSRLEFAGRKAFDRGVREGIAEVAENTAAVAREIPSASLRTGFRSA
jgi:hypothetical protein